MYYLGLAILIWCSVGFLVGLKQIYIDKKVGTDEALEQMREELKHDPSAFHWVEIVNKKPVFLATTTLMGFYSFYLDTLSTFQK